MATMQKVALRDSIGRVHECDMTVSEGLPLVVAMQFSAHTQLVLQLQTDDLKAELSRWVNGAKVRKAALQLSDGSFEAMKRWYLTSNAPKPKDLAMWALSRCTLTSEPWGILFGSGNAEEEEAAEEKQGRRQSRSESKGIDIDDESELSDGDPPDYTETMSFHNYPDEEDDQDEDEDEDEDGDEDEDEELGKPPNYTATADWLDLDGARPDSSSSPMRPVAADMTSMNLATSTLARKRVRKDATKTLVKEGWSDNKHHLDRALKHTVMQLQLRAEDQRREVEVTKTRNKQTANRLLKEKARQQKALEDRQWEQRATLEALQLQQAVITVEEDLRRQKCKAQKQVQQIAWTIQPFRERRGRSMPGAYLGPGPLPAAATTALAHSAEQEVSKSYYWDVHGRRHRRQFGEEFSSAVEEALEVLKRAAETGILHELDLKKIIRKFDADGDGQLNLEEFGRGILATGVPLSVDQLAALFKHFDRDGSGQVTTGEFMWAFFNRRKFLREWRRASKGMTTGQILATFHRFDENGNGKLSENELMRTLQHLSIECDLQEAAAVVERFDRDGDAQLDIHEFITYLQSNTQESKTGQNARGASS